MLGPLLRLASGLAVRPLTVARHGSDLAVELMRIGAAGPDRIERVVAAAAAVTDGLVDEAGLDDADRDTLHRLREEVTAVLTGAARDGIRALLDGRAADGARTVPISERAADRADRDGRAGSDGASALIDGRAAPWTPDEAPERGGHATPWTQDGTAQLDGRTEGPARHRATPAPDGRLGNGAGPRSGPAVGDGTDSGGEGQPARPSLLPPGAVLGEDVAATAGAVVLRDPAFELIQYLPRTATVRATPLLVVPPPDGSFLAADLAPGRSFVERLVGTGQQVLLVSWGSPRDPGAVLGSALEACERITRSPVTALLGFGTGAAAAADLAAATPGRIATLTLVADGVDTPPPPAGPAYVVERDLLDEGWWPEHAAWLHLRTGEDVEAPAELGGRGLPPMQAAPGSLAGTR